MSDLSLDQKSKLAAELIVQSPPGEVNDVINDLRNIINDDEKLMGYVRPALRSYNLSQLTAVEHPAAEGVPAHSSLLSEATVLPGSEEDGERHVDAEHKRSFVFDHITLAVSDYQPYELPEEDETFRAELAKSLAAYTKNHFQSGSYAVSTSQFPLLPPAPPAPVAPAAATIDAAEETSEEDKPVLDATGAEDADRVTAEPAITDIVPEQITTGENEPAPTPAVGDSPKEELDQPGGVAKADEELAEAKQQEEGEAKPEEGATDAAAVEEEKTEGAEAVHEPPVISEGKPQVEEVAPEKETVAAETATEDKREQKRVDNPVYSLEIVGNRYNPSNFWTGRWRTQWVVDQAAGLVSGTIQVDVHYYEQGNVQLATKHSGSFPCPTQSNGSQSVASQIVTAIAKAETNYQLELTDVYDQLGDKAFRALRRALPVTRQKMDWEKVGGYSLGSDLSKARA